jgi:hypothetical protein
MLNVSSMIKGAIAALAVVVGGATATAVVSNVRAPHAAVAPELTRGALQSTADRFRWEFAEWPQRPRPRHSLIKHRR